MKSLLKKYSDENPERFNKEFILSREKEDILSYVKDIFKTLEVLPEIKVLDVTMNTDESSFSPIINQHRYYKSILPSRLNKIHYKIKITPSNEKSDDTIFLNENEIEKDTALTNADMAPVIIEKDIFINKLIDDCFYINEGIRYFLIYQIVDNSTYGTKDMVSLKSLLMPIAIMHSKTTRHGDFDIISGGIPGKSTYPLNSYDVLLFSKKINPVLYVFGKLSYNMIVETPIIDINNKIKERQDLKKIDIIDKFNEFFNTDFEFADDLGYDKFNNPSSSASLPILRDGRTIFRTSEKGVYISVSTDKLEANDKNTYAILGSLLDIHSENKKKRIEFAYKDIVRPWFWIDKLSNYFTKNTDPEKKMQKIKTMLISLDRLIDDTTKEILLLKDSDKDSTLAIIRYILRNFEDLSKSDNQDLDYKRIRLYEYELYPLRTYFSNQIYHVLNSPTRSRIILERIFSNLNPMYIIKKTVTNELLRYYNASNDFNLFSALLHYTFRGPQSLNKSVSTIQRDIHPSYVGRLSLVSASPSDPGLSGNLTPFIEVDEGGYFNALKGKKS